MTPTRARGFRRRIAQLPSMVAVLAVTVFVEAGLRVTTLPTLARALGVPLATDDQRSEDPTTTAAAPVPAHQTSLPTWARRRVRATQRVLRHWPYGNTCLRQALVSGQRLRRLHPVLHVGVAKLEGEVRAHAWLVVCGVVVDPMRAASSYLTLTVPTTEPPA